MAIDSVSVEITFSDACQDVSAQIVAQTIAKMEAIWTVDATKSFTLNSFTDSIDSTGAYTQGVCGAKTFTLISPPAFLSAAEGSDPILDDITFSYDASFATDTDIMVHTIDYQVTNTYYPGWAPLIDTFEFEIKCPSTVQSSTVTTPINFFSIPYDLAEQPIVEVTKTLPVLSVEPSICFAVDSYTVRW